MTGTRVESAPGPGPITLRVHRPDVVLEWYTGLLGLDVADGDRGAWRLSAPGSTETLLRVEGGPGEDRGDADGGGAPAGRDRGTSGTDRSGRPGRRTAGLFHLALLVPSRADLGAVFLRLREAGASLAGGSFQGASDHGVSRALYLADPEGNGIEIYHDRPRDAWPSRDGGDGGVTMFTRPLDLDALVEGVEEPRPLPEGTTVGHVHLRTTDLAAAEAFWTRETGMSATERSYPGALFLAHGDYHHHLGLNVWGGPFEPATGDGPGLVRMEWRTGGGGTGSPAGTGARVLHSPEGVEVVVREG